MGRGVWSTTSLDVYLMVRVKHPITRQEGSRWPRMMVIGLKQASEDWFKCKGYKVVVP